MAPRMIDSREVKHRTHKMALWIVWLLIMVVSVAYCVLSFLSFQKVMRIYNRDNNGIKEKGTLWATLCATFIGPFTVVAFFALGSVLLLKKTVSESGLTYSYGALHWSSLWMAVVVLQSAVSLQGQKGTMEDLWEKKPAEEGIAPDLPWSGGDTALCKGTYVFAYILAILYLLLFLLLFIFRDAARKLYIPPEKALTSPLASEDKHHHHGHHHGKHHDVTPAAAAAAAAPAPAGTTATPGYAPTAASAAAAPPPAQPAKHKKGWFGRHKKGDSATEMPAAPTGPAGGVVTEDIRPVVVRPTGAPGEAQPAI